MAIIICLCLNGCINKYEVEIAVVSCGFKCEFGIIGSELSGEMTVNQDGKLNMVFSGPDIINGVGITVVGETVIIDVRGITERYSRNTVPKDSPATYLYDILADISTLTPQINNDEITVSGNCESGKYDAVLNGTGFIEGITLADTGLNIEFKNHIMLN